MVRQLGKILPSMREGGDIGVLRLKVEQVRLVRAFVAIGAGFAHHQRDKAVLHRVQSRGANAAGGRASRHNHRVNAVPGQKARQRCFKKHARHPLRILQITRMNIAARIEFVPFGAIFDILQTVLSVGPRAPDTGIIGIVHIANLAPDHRHSLFTGEP